MTAAQTPGPTRRRSTATSAESTVVPLHGYRFTDVGNALRMVALHRDRLRYVSDTGHWYVWDGLRWAVDPDRAGVMNASIDTVRSMYQEAADPSGATDRQALARHAIASEARSRIEAAVVLAATQSELRVTAEDLDPDPMLLGVGNGTLDLRAGIVRNPDPADLITHQVPVDYDPAATCPLWEKTLEQIQPDPELRGFLQRAIGYSLTGSTKDQVMFLAYGRGANGKSLVIETMNALLAGYYQKAPADLLLARSQNSDLSNDVARIRGARFVSVVETDEGRRLGEARVKEITGGDTVTARFLHKEFFEFRPVCKLWLVTNHLPRIAGTDDGIWRRLVTIPFTEHIDEKVRDGELPQKLRAELPGILAWAVRGCLEWQRRGLDKPATVTEAAREYRADQDVIGAFLADRCVQREKVRVTAKALYAAYLAWAEENGHSPVSQTILGSKLRDRGFTKIKHGTVSWHGLALAADGYEDQSPQLPEDEEETPPAVHDARIGEFLDLRCVRGARLEVAASTLYTAYSTWCAVIGYDPATQVRLGNVLGARGFARVKVGTVRWRGLDLAPLDLTPTDSAAAPAPAITVCRACGLVCDPVNEGLHPNCTDPDDPNDDGPGGAPVDVPPAPETGPDGAAATPSDPAADDQPTVSAPPAHRSVEDGSDGAVVTARKRRPWTPKSTVYLTWSSGTAVDDTGAKLSLPRRARLVDLLDTLPADTQRVVLVGAMPGGNGPGLQAWATDTLPDGWAEAPAGHYLDPDALAARYLRPDGGELHVHRLASWVRDTTGTIRPDTARSAFELLRRGLGEVFGRRRVVPGETVTELDPSLAPAILSSPASTGRELLLRTLPAGHHYPVLSDDALELLHHTTGQGRNELLTEDPETYPADELPGLYSYDMRWAYAALCRGVTGSGPTALESTDEFLGYAPARYEVAFTVPEGWDHIGLLGVHGEGWPATPGTRGRTWCDARELRLADRFGWRIGRDVQIIRRLRFTTDKSTPLRAWADKLTEVRETWLPAADAPAPVIALARDMTRTILLASLGALQGRRQKITHAVPRDRASEIPAGAAVSISGGMLVWTSETSAGWREMVHPEWVGQIWAEQRCRLLSTGEKAHQANAGALHIPRRELVALRTDAVYSTTDPGWPDTGRVGEFRPQLRLNGPVPTPRSVESLMTLRAES